jgi:hypothetical protein
MKSQEKNNSIIESINNAVQLHEPNTIVILKSVENDGLHLEVLFTDIDKIIGLKEIKKIINKHLSDSNMKCLSIKLK